MTASWSSATSPSSTTNGSGHRYTHVHWLVNVDRLSNVDDDGPAQPRRRLTQAEAKEQTRGNLLAAAARVFAQKGFAGATLEEIAEQAGYSTGAVYYNFSGKEQLFLELLKSGPSRRLTARVKAVTWAFSQGPAAGPAAGEDPFDALSRLVVQIAERDSELTPLAAEFWLYAFRNPEAMELIAANLAEEDKGLEPVIAAAMDRYSAAPGISSTEMTMVTLMLFNSMVRRRRMDPGAVPDDLFARVLRRLFAAERAP
jgi:AcrR family transcriptional regulator